MIEGIFMKFLLFHESVTFTCSTVKIGSIMIKFANFHVDFPGINLGDI